MTITPEIEAKWRSEFEYMLYPPAEKMKYRYMHKMLMRHKDRNEEYAQIWVENRWQGFLMARKSVAIRIPELYIIEHAYQDKEQGYNDCVDDCVEVIESQGYRVVSGAYDSNNTKLINPPQGE